MHSSNSHIHFLETKTIQVCYAKLNNFPIYEIHSKELNNYYALMEVFKFVSIVIRYFIGLHSTFVYTASIKTWTNQTRSVAHISSRPEPTVVSSSHNSVLVFDHIKLGICFLTARHFSGNENDSLRFDLQIHSDFTLWIFFFIWRN